MECPLAQWFEILCYGESNEEKERRIKVTVLPKECYLVVYLRHKTSFFEERLLLSELLRLLSAYEYYFSLSDILLGSSFVPQKTKNMGLIHWSHSPVSVDVFT